MREQKNAHSSVDWDELDQPRSRLYGDLYFSKGDGLGEARAVFLAGCDLPAAWSGRDHFCVAELGFGTGLNIVALLDLWRRTRRPDARLSIFSVEAHPLTAPEAMRALARWPELSPLTAALAARWPGRARGFHRIDLPDLHATIDVAVMEVADALRAWSGPADAWFLDGFAPALNPDMWRREVIDLVVARSAPGARAASYTVAGAVRRDMAAAGFTVHRRPGFGAKRERLEARLPGGPPAGHLGPRPRVVIVGAGISGAALSRAFRALGVEAVVFDIAGPGAGASGGPAALAAPRLDAGLGPQAALFAQAMRRAASLYDETPFAIIARQAAQLETGAKDPERFAAIAASDLFEPDAMRHMDGLAMAGVLGEAAPEGLRIDQALVVDPMLVLNAWLGETTRAQVATLQPHEDGWRLADAGGETIFEADVVCLAAGMGCTQLALELVLTPVRGQASWTSDLAWPMATMFGGYVIPTRVGLLFGATHDRGDSGLDAREADDARNLDAVRQVLPHLAGRLAGARLEAWTAIRATTSDYLPLAGAVPGAPRGLFALTGLGSRGFCLAPLLAEHVAAQAMHLPSPLPRTLADLVDPARFAVRAARKGRPVGRSPDTA